MDASSGSLDAARSAVPYHSNFSPAFSAMSRQKFRRAHPPAAFALQFQNPQRALAAGDHNPIFVRR